MDIAGANVGATLVREPAHHLDLPCPRGPRKCCRPIISRCVHVAAALLDQVTAHTYMTIAGGPVQRRSACIRAPAALGALARARVHTKLLAKHTHGTQVTSARGPQQRACASRIAGRARIPAGCGGIAESLFIARARGLEPRIGHRTDAPLRDQLRERASVTCTRGRKAALQVHGIKLSTGCLGCTRSHAHTIASRCAPVRSRHELGRREAWRMRRERSGSCGGLLHCRGVCSAVRGFDMPPQRRFSAQEPAAFAALDLASPISAPRRERSRRHRERPPPRDETRVRNRGPRHRLEQHLADLHERQRASHAVV
mmetsp:Transcript_381/g.1489  ORF Transcript_381/g.1489 Transcript_381/m.1489 type:complete len:313 (+) Transcript_381:2485-3423(+)